MATSVSHGVMGEGGTPIHPMYGVDSTQENTFLRSLPTSPGRDSSRVSSRHVLTDGALRLPFSQEGKLIQENVGEGEGQP